MDDKLKKSEEKLRELRRKLSQTEDMKEKHELVLKINVVESQLKLYRFQKSLK